MPWGPDHNPNSSSVVGGQRGVAGCLKATASSIISANKFNFLIQAEISTVATNTTCTHTDTHTYFGKIN